MKSTALLAFPACKGAPLAAGKPTKRRNFVGSFRGGSKGWKRHLISTHSNGKITEIYCGMFICLGPSGSGKTALLSRLQDANSITYPCPNPATIPTMGTSWVTVNCQASGKGKGKLNRNREVTIRELGGAMAPIWPSYFSECPNGLLFVIDSSNCLQIAAATMLLLRSLSQHQMPRQCLIILNKLDICSDMSLHDLLFMLRLDDIQKHSECQINVIRSSTITGQGIDEILQWLKSHLPN